MSLVFIGISPLILYGYTRWENRLLHPYTCSDEQDTCPLERHRTLACPRTDHRREKSEERRAKSEEGIRRQGSKDPSCTTSHHYSFSFSHLSLFFVKWHMGFACLRSPTLATPNLYRLVPGSLGFRFTGGVCKLFHQHILKAKRTTQPKTRFYQLLSHQSHLLPLLFIPKDFK